jgi:hypothetical protein
MTTSRRTAQNPSVNDLNTDRFDITRLRQLADEYLIDQVGDLLVSGAPEAVGADSWEIPILLSTSRRGILGQVGTLKTTSVGEIRALTAKEFEELKRRAREVAIGSPR